MDDGELFVHATTAFGPEATTAMSGAFDDVCRILKVNGNVREREVIAMRIVEWARRGQHSRAKLRDLVLGDAGHRDVARPL